uniref:Uncharacterized protein n=1 Tax=Anguilla anguilla TaxID=7936 RepID=A0A0E9TQJ2_ANGAN
MDPSRNHRAYRLAVAKLSPSVHPLHAPAAERHDFHPRGEQELRGKPGQF